MNLIIAFRSGELTTIDLAYFRSQGRQRANPERRRNSSNLPAAAERPSLPGGPLYPTMALEMAILQRVLW
jgi:hypothetical protein